MHGSNVGDQNSVYGTKGIPDNNNTPSSRAHFASWTDLSGNLWIYGGTSYGSSGNKSDLWQYNISTNQWVWINGETTPWTVPVYGTKGIPDVLNKPGARTESATWRDNNGNLWLYGGRSNHQQSGGTVGDFGELWKYDVSINQWSWESGGTFFSSQIPIYGTKGIGDVNNGPGSRLSSITWIDLSGNLWLFGGTGVNLTGFAGAKNDLWKYEIASKEWTWVTGDIAVDQNGVYGTQGVASPSNKPGARQGAMSWTDNDGSFWLFGGHGYPANGGNHYLNDLWMFNPITSLWTWVGGGNTINQPNVYGLLGIPNPFNTPGARVAGKTVKDTDGNLWLFGGLGPVNGNPFISEQYNDLWRYDISTNQWAWISGDNIANQFGIYGDRQVINSSNKPGSRFAGTAWIDPNENIWIMGGSGVSSNTSGVMLNDVWRFGPDPCFGNNFSVSIPDAKTLNYNSIANNTVYPPYTPASSLTLTAQVSGGSGLLTYSWSNGASTPSITASPLSTTTYTVAATDAVGCQVTASKQITVSNVNCNNSNIYMCHVTGNSSHVNTICIGENAVQSHLAAGCSLGECTAGRAVTLTGEMETNTSSIQILPNPSNSYFTIKLGNYISSAVSIRIYDILGRVVETKSNISSNMKFGDKLSPGIYLVEINQNEKKYVIKLAKQ